MKYRVKHIISLGILLFALWVVLSGKFNVLMLSLGLASTVLIVLITLRMDRTDREQYPVHMTILLWRFWLFLAREVIISNIDVIKRILKPGKNISPQFFDIPLKHKADLSHVIYANSITLTPGTVSVDMDDESITVHSISHESANDLRSGRMANVIPEEYGVE
jgi:multicomponent Na+:H+ antiporter subunit E